MGLLNAPCSRSFAATESGAFPPFPLPSVGAALLLKNAINWLYHSPGRAYVDIWWMGVASKEARRDGNSTSDLQVRHVTNASLQTFGSPFLLATIYLAFPMKSKTPLDNVDIDMLKKSTPEFKARKYLPSFPSQRTMGQSWLGRLFNISSQSITQT